MGRRYSKDAAIVLEQNVHYQAVRDAILESGIGGGGAGGGSNGSMLRRHGQRSGGNSFLNGKRKATPWGQNLTTDVRKIDRTSRVMANGSHNSMISRRVANSVKDDTPMDDRLPEIEESESECQKNEDQPPSSPVQIKKKTSAVDQNQTLVTPESPHSVGEESSPEEERPIKISSNKDINNNSKNDSDLDLDDEKSIDSQTTTTTPIPTPSADPSIITKVSPTGTDSITTEQPPKKIVPGMTLRRRQKRTPSRKVDAASSSVTAADTTTPRKLSTIGHYFSPDKKHKSVRDIEEDDADDDDSGDNSNDEGDENVEDDNSHLSEVVDDDDISQSSIPKNKQLRVNNALHLIDADEDGGMLVEPSSTTCFRGLKRLFSLLNNGERI